HLPTYTILFPYTTLFRSNYIFFCNILIEFLSPCGMNKIVFSLLVLLMTTPLVAQDFVFGLRGGPSYTTLGVEGAYIDPKFRFGRSEEHTSELQSRENLVC